MKAIVQVVAIIVVISVHLNTFLDTFLILSGQYISDNDGNVRSERNKSITKNRCKVLMLMVGGSLHLNGRDPFQINNCFFLCRKVVCLFFLLFLFL